ncbi:hypothetical protein [Gloeobacter violaceus]|uniref:hypothetical protein n=1 Tax=Gloeobacter violaceus TaxID=33072 RepID=UPI0013E8F10E|nr:hypothetical protein [Gloeobacter violaceus]
MAFLTTLAGPVATLLAGIITAWTAFKVAEYNYRTINSKQVQERLPIKIKRIEQKTINKLSRIGELFWWSCVCFFAVFPTFLVILLASETTRTRLANDLGFALNYLFLFLATIAAAIYLIPSTQKLERQLSPKATVEIEARWQDILSACRTALRAIDASIKTFDSEVGLIRATMRVSLLSVGQELVIRIRKRDSDSVSQIHLVEIESIFPLKPTNANREPQGHKQVSKDEANLSEIHGINVNKFVQQLEKSEARSTDVEAGTFLPSSEGSDTHPPSNVVGSFDRKSWELILKEIRKIREEESEHKVKPENGKFKRTFGSAKGLIKVAPDFDAPLPNDIMKHFE